MAIVPDEYLEKLKEDAAEAAQLRDIVAEVTYYVRAACKCGFTDRNQEDALYFALEKLTGQPKAMLALIIDVTPKGLKHGR